MRFALKFELKGLPKSLNGSHGHWRAAAAERKRWRLATYRIAHPMRPKTPLVECEITCTRHSSMPSDYDNLTASFKAVIDGLKDAGVILDDSMKVIVKRTYLNEKAKRNEGRISILVVGSLQEEEIKNGV